jgi:hypothetical protein
MYLCMFDTYKRSKQKYLIVFIKIFVERKGIEGVLWKYVRYLIFNGEL